MKASRTASTRRSAQTGQFVLTSGRGEKISAVEGMKVTARMGQILTQSRMVRPELPVRGRHYCNEVLSFAFRVGTAIPPAEWARLGLPIRY